MSERIESAFSTGPAGRVRGWVQRRNDDGSYIVLTAAGARIRAESPEYYATGTRVTVLQGRILGVTGGGKSKVVEV